MKLSFQISILGLLATVSSFLAAAPTPEQIAAESLRANAFFDRAFDEAVARSPQWMTQLGLKSKYDQWDDLSEQHAAGNLALVASQLADLKQNVDFTALDEPTRLSYRLFERNAEETIEGWRWRYHDYVINQMSGLHSEAPAFLINAHTIETLQEARDYIARLRGIGPLFDQLIAAWRLRADRQIAPPRFVFPLVVASCREVITGEPFDQSGKPCALMEDFANKVDRLAVIDPETRMQLLAETRQVLVAVVRPAYERLITALQETERLATDDDGVWKLPDGDEYYAFALRQATTTRMSAEEIHQLGLREVARIHHDMAAIIRQVGFQSEPAASQEETLQAFFKFVREDPQFYYPTTPEGKAAYMQRATEIIEAMRARLDEFFITKPKIPMVIKPVEPFREQGAASASYEEAPPDGSRPATYFINTVDMKGLPIFEMETLAHHEAIPGHHMQVAIAQGLTDLPKFRRHIWNTAYGEGWALYAEYFPKEFGFYSDPYMDFGRLYDELLRAVRLVVDTGLHAKHWTRQQVIDYFKANTPNSERDIVAEVNRYIVWPGQATSYKIGQLKILELRELARRELGPRFDLREYHDLVLKNGALPLDLLEENVRSWIISRR